MKCFFKPLRSCLAAFVLLSAPRAEADFQGATHLMPFEEDTINYNNTPDQGPIASLQRRLEAGEVTARFDREHGYLPWLLDELKILKSSQMLVFSKTSLQREHISPRTPRAIFFNDEVYVGFIPGAPLIEISAADPKLGGVFYTLEQTEQSKLRVVRNNQCTECHASAKTMGVPGHLVRSFATDDNGVADISSGISQVNHRTPFADRWGGWYVTGFHGKQAHRGNLIGKAAFERHAKEPGAHANITNLSTFFDVSSYPLNQSDVVALMVLEHQTHMHNFITRLNYEATLAVRQYGHIRYLKNISEAFLKYLLFIEEIQLTEPIRGNPQFTAGFAAAGPRDRRDRSLRDFDLTTRLFKHPCSYLIYSDAFEAMPSAIKDHLYRRLWEILSGEDTTAGFARLSPGDRRAILEILRETKRGLPDYWKANSTTASNQSKQPQENAGPSL